MWRRGKRNIALSEKCFSCWKNGCRIKFVPQWVIKQEWHEFFYEQCHSYIWGVCNNFEEGKRENCILSPRKTSMVCACILERCSWIGKGHFHQHELSIWWNKTFHKLTNNKFLLRCNGMQFYVAPSPGSSLHAEACCLANENIKGTRWRIGLKDYTKQGYAFTGISFVVSSRTPLCMLMHMREGKFAFNTSRCDCSYKLWDKCTQGTTSVLFPSQKSDDMIAMSRK